MIFNMPMSLTLSFGVTVASMLSVGIAFTSEWNIGVVLAPEFSGDAVNTFAVIFVITVGAEPITSVGAIEVSICAGNAQ